LVRRRVVEHLREQLGGYSRRLGDGLHLDLHRIDVDALQSMLASYLGHFRHANSYRLLLSLWQQYPWLGQLFTLNPVTASITSRLEPPIVTGLSSQTSWFQQQYPEHQLVMQVGWRMVVLPAGLAPTDTYLIVEERGYLKRGLKRRVVTEIYG
jgi:hypothetical protein